MTDRKISLKELQEGSNAIPKKLTFRNYAAILNKVNEHYGWEKDIIHYDRLNEVVDELPDFIKETWKIGCLSTLKQKLSAISSLMTRSGFGHEHKVKKIIRNADRFLEVKVVPVTKDVPDWETVVLNLKKVAQEGDTVCGIIANIFSYGYVLRVGEIFTTKLVDDGVHNFLDLDNCKWTVRMQKNGKHKVFDVDPELCKSLPSGREWLLRKSDSSPFSKCTHRLRYHGWELWDNNTIRQSYETFNMNSDRSEEEKQRWHDILGHSKVVAEDFYRQYKDTNKPKPVIVKKNQKIKPIVIKRDNYSTISH